MADRGVTQAAQIFVLQATAAGAAVKVSEVPVGIFYDLMNTRVNGFAPAGAGVSPGNANWKDAWLG
jgi:hypothetical protein